MNKLKFKVKFNIQTTFNNPFFRLSSQIAYTIFTLTFFPISVYGDRSDKLQNVFKEWKFKTKGCTINTKLGMLSTLYRTSQFVTNGFTFPSKAQ